MGGIPVQATRKELFDVFSAFGAIRSFNLSKNESDPALNKGFGFIIYENSEDARKVVDHQKNHILRSKVVGSPAGRPACRHEFAAGPFQV